MCGPKEFRQLRHDDDEDQPIRTKTPEHQTVEVAVELVSDDSDAPLTDFEEEKEDRAMTVGEVVDGASKALQVVGRNARRAVDAGRYRKVRISRNGKPVVPDIPLAVFAALEIASLAGAGLGRVIAANVGARFLFDIEVVNEADKYYKVGVERFLEGDLERAEQGLLKAAQIDDTYAAAYLQLGVLYRMQGKMEQARAVLERATFLDDAGEIGRKAGDILRALDVE